MKNFIRITLLILIGITACAPTAPVLEETPSSPNLPSADSSPTRAALTATATATLAPGETPLPTPTVPASPTVRPTLSANAWMDMPVVPTISESVRAIYQNGLTLGNDPRKFAKIGDCQNIESYFLALYETPSEYDLGEYASLQATIDYYKGSFGRDSLAVAGGFNVAAILTAGRSPSPLCNVRLSPMECELTNWNASVALVSLEEWWSDRPVEQYETYLRRAVQILIERGIVPILATKPGNTPHDHAINAAIAKVAYDYDIPLWNFWRAIQPLPNNGLMEDGFHLTYARSFFNDPIRMQSAWPWRNLTALQTLDSVRRGLGK
jgi:hypothetical protein